MIFLFPSQCSAIVVLIYLMKNTIVQLSSQLIED